MISLIRSCRISALRGTYSSEADKEPMRISQPKPFNVTQDVGGLLVTLHVSGTNLKDLTIVRTVNNTESPLIEDKDGSLGLRRMTAYWCR